MQTKIDLGSLVVHLESSSCEWVMNMRKFQSFSYEGRVFAEMYFGYRCAIIVANIVIKAHIVLIIWVDLRVTKLLLKIFISPLVTLLWPVSSPLGFVIKISHSYQSDWVILRDWKFNRIINCKNLSSLTVSLSCSLLLTLWGKYYIVLLCIRVNMFPYVFWFY